MLIKKNFNFKNGFGMAKISVAKMKNKISKKKFFHFCNGYLGHPKPFLKLKFFFISILFYPFSKMVATVGFAPGTGRIRPLLKNL